jgi:CheY-like chemotaxis protein
LGLAISNEIVKLMGGQIKVISEVDKGSTFSFTIKCKETIKENISSPELHKQVIGLAKEGLLNRVLVVDDIADNRNLISRILQNAGFIVTEAKNGKEAIDKLHAKTFDIVFMDMRMPVMDGYEAIPLIRANKKTKSIPIVGVTASVFKEQKQKVLDIGANEFLRKPFADYQLFEIIKNCIPVEYIYEEPIVVEETIEVPDKLQLDNIPEELLNKLRELSNKGMYEEFEGVIENIATHNPETARILKHLFDQFEYDMIIRLL